MIFLLFPYRVLNSWGAGLPQLQCKICNYLSDMKGRLNNFIIPHLAMETSDIIEWQISCSLALLCNILNKKRIFIKTWKIKSYSSSFPFVVANSPHKFLLVTFFSSCISQKKVIQHCYSFWQPKMTLISADTVGGIINQGCCDGPEYFSPAAHKSDAVPHWKCTGSP